VTGRAMPTWLHHLITLLLALVVVTLFWATQAAWGRAEIDDVRYKFGLVGVSSIARADTEFERVQICGWYDEPPLAPFCRAAAGAAGAYQMVRLAPVAAAATVIAFVLAAFAHLRRGSGMTGTPLPPFALAGAAAMLATILLLTLNVGHALDIYTGRPLSMRGSGLSAAWCTVLLLAATAAFGRLSSE
jgi:hypothetical protein